MCYGGCNCKRCAGETELHEGQAHDEWVEKYQQLEQQNAALREALQALYDVQNGCPLPKYQADWDKAMEMTDRLLRRINMDVWPDGGIGRMHTHPFWGKCTCCGAASGFLQIVVELVRIVAIGGCLVYFAFKFSAALVNMNG